ncbi:YcaO-like family protein [Streptomyces sp. ODS05-4]|uniref:YcaO-like family protein n=1 Tax=Streptomyces sp. ODS05-4 TaxID=2944939 RepID=UPI00210D36D9|nr:YcaO-like family protein [Streptomyces sp. ODS05-4]
MRPQLIRDAYFVPLDGDGVYLRSSHRVVTIERAPVYPLLERLAPYLNGRYTVAELTARLPEPKAALIADLVRMLHDLHVVRDLSQDLPHTLDERETRAYEAELAYVETYAGSAEHHFQRFRETSVLLVGSGRLLETAAQAALGSGVRRVRLLITDDTATDLDQLRGHLRDALARDPRQELTWASAPNDPDGSGWAESLRGHDAVLHLSERPMLARGRLLDAGAEQTGTLTQHTVVLPGEAWIGPLRIPAEPGGGWEAAWRRLRPAAGVAPLDTGADHPGVSGDLFTGALPSIVANHAVFRLFTHLTGTSEHDWTRRLLRVDLETLETSHHSYHPHPHALPTGPETRDAFLARSVALAHGAQQPVEALSVAAAEHLDARCGLFATVGEEDATQLPLRVSRVEVPHPLTHASAVVYGVAVEFAEARYRAVRRAVELYGTGLYDPRRANADGTVWGLRLSDGEAVPVAASEVFDTTDRTWSEGPRTGAACGRDWNEAVATGLLSHCEELTIASASRHERTGPLVDLTSLAADEEIAHLTRLLDIAGVDVTAHEITDPVLRVPALAFRVDGRVVAHAAGLDLAGAVIAGLERTLLVWQAERHGEPWYAPAAPFPLPDASGDGPVPPAPDLRAEPVRELDDALRRVGRQAVAVPLDHDPALAEVAPYVLRIVVVHG